MYLMIVSLIFFILILIFNAIYSFLPSNVQSIPFVRTTAIICAIIILIIGIRQEIQKCRKFRFADISSADGTILKSKNFPWHVSKGKEGKNIYYIIRDRYGDASEVTVETKKSINCTISNAIAGIKITFSCKESDIPNFKIIISD